jgi:hypothetical protein
MKTVVAARAHGRRMAAVLTAVGCAVGLGAVLRPSSAEAFEAIEGRLQAHGYYEMQLRTISRNFSDQWDVTQWYNIFNLELELDMVQTTHGPLDLMSAFVRIEARFDCIYSRGCGVVRGVDVYGNRARRLPNRLQGGDEFTHAGSIFVERDGPWPVTPERNPYTLREVPAFRGIYEATEEGLGPANRSVQFQCGAPVGTGGSAFCPDGGGVYRPGRVAARFWQADRNRRIADFDGNAIDDGTDGAPYLVALRDFKDFEFTAIPIIGGSNSGNPLLLMGPWLPENTVETNATLADLPSPLDASRVSPQSLVNGGGANPMRPIPIFREDEAGKDQIWIRQTTELDGQPAVSSGRWESINPTTGQFGDVREWNDRAALPWEARGSFTPSPQLRRALQEDKFTPYPFNITELDRAFNRGWSQNDEGELKEAYLDIEMFDSRLWMRIGKQSIVWGKTELFRTTDQFNPQDLALATLPSLEESRINLWAVRGVWSFYEVGPLSDVRVELAMNFDEYEAADLGSCGEPYAVNLVCGLTFGSWAHGVSGVGVAGFTAPPKPWDDPQGIEFGGRLEWRWDRYSFALIDFYGYNDFPHPVRLTTYSRNVDWRSGRPRYYMHTISQMANPVFSCATPGGKGVEFAVNPVTGGDDYTTAPLGPAQRITYDQGNEAGCLTPGPTNRQVRVLETLPGSGEYYGVPYRVPVSASDSNANKLQDYAGNYFNSSSRGDPNDPRFIYSRPATATPPTSAADWPDGPQALLCDTDPRLWIDPNNEAAGKHPDCTYTASVGGRGRRTFDTQKFVSWDPDDAGPAPARDVPNPNYNPFYDSRMDPYIDPTQAPRLLDDPTYFADPGDVIAASPVLFDPFQVFDQDVNRGYQLWANTYDPNLAFDERNALDLASVNQSLFNFVCATTVGFSDLDPSACALTVFSSPKEPAGNQGTAPRIATLIGGFLVGAPLFNGFVGKLPTDELLSKGPLLPDGMGMPLVQLNIDMGVPVDPADPNDTLAPTIGQGLDAFRTVDRRRHWADLASGTLPAQTSQSYPWIYSRESESYNCLPELYVRVSNQAPQLCGGLSIRGNQIEDGMGGGNNGVAFQVTTFLARSLAPEQEALLGCGPFFASSCDANGIDLMWAEGSAVLQSFVGADSLGIPFELMGIQDLVPASFGTSLMDNGSPSQEYRTDSRVIGSNGRLIRIDDTSLTPALGSDGYLRGIGVGNLNANNPASTRGDCNIQATRIVNPDGSLDFSQDRIQARCWDLRRYFVAYGVQPGTAAFEILGLGGPKCTTADVGGPLDPRASVLPGCRDKWATIQYEPLDGWDPATGLHPNNPDAGYIGNNWYGQIFSYKAAAALNRPTAFDPDVLPQPRTDYRQWSSDPTAHVRRDMIADTNGTELAASVPCAAPNTPANPDAQDGPESYDCYLRNPSFRPQPNDGLPMWLTVYNCTANPNDPRCVTGPDGPDDVDLQDMLPASIRLSSSWAKDGTDERYELAKTSRRSGLNWGVYDPGLAGCDPNRTLQEMQDDPDCYVGGWRQGVDGDPDRLGIGGGTDILYPRYERAFGNVFEVAFDQNYGYRVENGCTRGQSWIYIQRTADNRLLSPAECVNVFTNPTEQPDGTRWPNELLGGVGNPFTGESFANELSGVSNNLMHLLVTFSDEFTDGLASVRGFVAPEIYESRFIYDEEWMWNPECDGVVKTAAECGGRLFVQDPTFPSNVDPLHSAYGDPNRDPMDPQLKPYTDPNFDYRIRQAFRVNGLGQVILNSRVGWQSTGLGNVSSTSITARSARVPNPLPPGETNRLQRDPSLPNILTTFPDLLMRECNSARRDYQQGMSPAEIRNLYERCGAVNKMIEDPMNPGTMIPDPFAGLADWTQRIDGTFFQDIRLGNSAGESINGVSPLIKTMLWDYAFTGTENDLMAMIPYCENLEYTQRHVATGGDSGAQPSGQSIFGPTRIDCSRGLAGEVLGRERCTFVTPQYCELVQALYSLAGQKRPIVQAGGNGRFGRRTMQWHSGNEIYLDYAKRNVLGFSMDFAEDYTKSNWSVEFTWIEGVPQIDNSSYNLTTDVDDYNLTVSVDRPTFINFLNANRTFFINSQWFFQYRDGWNSDFTTPGPWNVLATFAVFTGYFQDRLNPTMVFVWDFRSSSGAALPQVNYRFSENFSITVGASIFTGDQGLVNMPVNPIAPSGPRAGPNAYMDGTEPGLSLVRDRDEVFMTLRYTF